MPWVRDGRDLPGLVVGWGKGAGWTGPRIARLRVRDGDDCRWCSGPIDFTIPHGEKWSASVDHIRPRAAGGTGELANLQLMHSRPCQHKKGSVWEGVDYAKANDPGYQVRHWTQGERKDWYARYDWDVTADSSDWETPVVVCWET